MGTDIVFQFNALSEPRKSLLLWTFDLFIKITEYKPMNKMTLQSMSIVFSPNMVRCADPNPMIFLELQKKVQRVILDAAKLRDEHRLITHRNDSESIQLVPFQRDRSKLPGNDSCEGPKYAKYVANNQGNGGISGLFKNCIVL